jgi:hypothetical protein
MKVALGEGHGGIEANDRKETRDVKDGLDDMLADGGVHVIELRGVIPGKACAIIAVVDVADVAGEVVAAAEDDGSIFLRKIFVVDFDFDARIGGEIGTVEAVGRVGRVGAGHEPVGVFDDPGRVDAHSDRHARSEHGIRNVVT